MIKLADTLAPMADFPAAYAKDIEFDDGKNLQEKLNNGELGGGGTPTPTPENYYTKAETEKLISENVQTITDDEITNILSEIF